MDKRNLSITIDTAKKWYNGTDEELKQLALETFPELIKKELPKSWEELSEIKGWYVNDYSNLRLSDSFAIDNNKNVFATKKQAKASIALAQLSQLREVYRQGWLPDWTDGSEKHSICLVKSKVSKWSCFDIDKFLSFQDEETRNLFLENFRDLIIEAKPLLS